MPESSMRVSIDICTSPVPVSRSMSMESMTASYGVSLGSCSTASGRRTHALFFSILVFLSCREEGGTPPPPAGGGHVPKAQRATSARTYRTHRRSHRLDLPHERRQGRRRSEGRGEEPRTDGGAEPDPLLTFFFECAILLMKIYVSTHKSIATFLLT